MFSQSVIKVNVLLTKDQLVTYNVPVYVSKKKKICVYILLYPLSTIFQFGGQFYWWRKADWIFPVKTKQIHICKSLSTLSTIQNLDVGSYR